MPPSIAIVTDSSAGLSIFEANEYDITVIPLFFHFPDGTIWIDNKSPDADLNFFNRLQLYGQPLGLIQIPIETSKLIIRNLLKHYDYVLFFVQSNTWLLNYWSLEKLISQREFNQRVQIIDFFASAIILKQMILLCAELIKKQLPLEEIIIWLKIWKNKTGCYFLSGINSSPWCDDYFPYKTKKYLKWFEWRLALKLTNQFNKVGLTINSPVKLVKKIINDIKKNFNLYNIEIWVLISAKNNPFNREYILLALNKANLKVNFFDRLPLFNGSILGEDSYIIAVVPKEL